MLKLADKSPLFVGGTRYCYIYPGDPGKCIKVLRPDRTGAARKQKMRGWKKFRPERYFDDQIKEIQAYSHLIRKNNPRIWEHIPEFFGTEETDMGTGIITRLFRNADGSLPDNLQTLLPNGKSAALDAGIQEFRRWLLDEVVITRDLLPHNIIAVARSDGSQQVLIVDGIGNADFIPVASWFDFFGKMKIKRKLTKFEHRMNLLLPQRES